MVQSSPQRQARDERTRVRCVGMDEVDNHILRIGLAGWQKACCGRKFPARGDIGLRDIAEVLPNTALIRVFGGGTDYEGCVLGDAVVRAYGIDLQRQKVSDLERDAPSFGKRLRTVLDRVIRARGPVAVYRVAGHDFPEARSPTAEAVLLPLGAQEAEIDYILAFISFGADFQ